MAITAAHRAAGYQFDTRAPQIRETLTGIKRTHGTHQAAKAPAVVADFKAMIEAQRGTLAGLRDCALLLLGFAGALRRSELSSLDVEAHWTVVRGSANRRVRVLDSGGWTFMTIRSKAHRGAIPLGQPVQEVRACCIVEFGNGEKLAVLAV